MFSSWANGRRSTVLIGALVFGLTLGGVAFVTAQTTSPEIAACYMNQTGVVRIVDAEADCRANETYISWNQIGPQGQQGEQGPAGSGGDNAIGALRFGVASTGCAQYGYRVIVAQAEGIVPAVVSGPCTEILSGRREASWGSYAAIPATEASTLLGRHWSPEQLDGVFIESEVEHWQLRCRVEGRSSDIHFEGGVRSASGDLVYIFCNALIQSEDILDYPVTGLTAIGESLNGALASGDLASAPLNFFQTDVLADTPPISTTTRPSTTTTTTTPPQLVDCPVDQESEPALRADMALTLWRRVGQPTPTMPGSSYFADIGSGTVYDEADGWILEAGISTGTSATTFSPETPMTRAEYVVFLYRSAESPTPSGTDPYTDVPATAFYVDAVAWSFEIGIAGTSPTTFSPDSIIMHQEAAGFILELDPAFDYWDCTIFGI